MTQTIQATFVDGVLKPDEPLNLPPNTQVRVTIVSPVTEEEKAFHKRGLEEFLRLARESPINSGGERLTREQLHERR